MRYEALMRSTALLASVALSACLCLECLQGGDVPPDGFDEADLAMVPDGGETPPDAGTSDQAAPPDMTTPPPACTDVTKTLAIGKAHACRGKIGGLNRTPAQLCRQEAGATCVPCVNASQIDATKAGALPGWYSAAPVGDKVGATVRCGAGSGTTLLAGGGARRSASTIDGSCGGFSTLMICDGSDGWSCPQTNIDTATSDKATDGVFCCCN
jgi:hypothetical protein